MVEIFKYVNRFFENLTDYLTFNYIFIIFVGLFLFTVLCIIFFTSRSYEAKLIKAIDKFNVYFIDNPQINEENLVAFNAKMKDKKVPKQLRKSWQQFVLYREDKASTYMSFENCVANPIKNSSYTRDLKSMNTLAWIFSLCSLILNVYYCYHTNLTHILRTCLLTPVIILLLNYIVHIFLNLRHSAIVSDLFQNYQYFEVNIDKATETLPEYVDYEVLFDRNEIKKGIPILYTYLQKRAEEEQRELERARLRNVEHEKFNFDDAGVAASLVLERAMQEAENYIAERKKYNQDTEQINSDMTQEDMNYREITKEYNRQMQVSKETFANFKSQLEEVSSTIEANYLKKQQQQELDRQRNLERDFDTATERHKKVIESYNAELDAVDKLIAQSRKNLENAMKSEFSSYSSKVYDEAKKLVEERQKDKVNKLKQNIEDLEEDLVGKKQELDQVYQQNQVMSEKLQEIGIVIGDQPETRSTQTQPVEEKNVQPIAEPEVQDVQEEQFEEITEEEFLPEPETEEPKQEPVEEVIKEDVQEENQELPSQPEEVPTTVNFEEELPEEDDDAEEGEEPQEISFDEFEEIQEDEEDEEDIYAEYVDDETQEQYDFADEVFNEVAPKSFAEYYAEYSKANGLIRERANKISTKSNKDDSIKKPVSKRGRPRKVIDTNKDSGVKKKGPGRPRKETTEVKTNVRRPGRPRKEAKPVVAEVKRSVGRPKKVETQTSVKRPGRPRKVEATATPKRAVGRPRKEESKPAQTAVKKRGRGRPRKVEVQQNLKRRGRPRKQVENMPKDIKDIDAYLKEIDNAIAAENAKLEKSKKALENKAKFKRKK